MITSTVVLNKFTYSKQTPFLVFVNFTACYYHLYNPIVACPSSSMNSSAVKAANHSSAFGTVREHLAEH
jgi:hypothetical protein